MFLRRGRNQTWAAVQDGVVGSLPYLGQVVGDSQEAFLPIRIKIEKDRASERERERERERGSEQVVAED